MVYGGDSEVKIKDIILRLIISFISIFYYNMVKAEDKVFIKDPFIPPWGIKAKSSDGENKLIEADISDKVRLDGIVYTKQTKAVLINHKIIRIGDEVNGRILYSIEKDRVLFKENGKLYEVSLQNNIYKNKGIFTNIGKQ